ncbi:RNI-like protein [Pseudovirgaria hyperparasitica]|uniref:RNI-like protein n=1 Tax=Pseudovirgaria hyperparasitica TaxID=470096 RepID=A0A6A6W711_9PEZI|nr:RNI-like protein [Pseudovirgaria hyperparasitica]KAF2757989.1 RNI-like protein [Pseudovirgaria hyperparasitica]
MDEQPKPKHRHRLMRGLSRMSSSPSLAKLTRSRSSSNPIYRAGDRGSMSCVSLASASPFGSYGSYASELSAGYSTAPTSVPGTPGPELPLSTKPRLHLFAADRPRTATMPSDIIASARMNAFDEADYFNLPVQKASKPFPRRPNFNFWEDMPFEVRLEIFRFLRPREIVQCSAVSKSWHKMCYDGQLWSRLDASEYYRDIPADSLVKIITNAGPFVRDLNLRGCVQLRERWNSKGLADACRNLENFSLEGCKIDRASVHCFLLQNTRLVSINLSGLQAATNAGLKIVAQHCPKLEELNVSWCQNIDGKGIKKVVESCANLKELRAGETGGWDDVDLTHEIFKRNTLERLVLNNCDSLTDDSLSALMIGIDSEIDVLTERAIVPPRKLKYLDLSRCRPITDKGVKTMAHNLPFLESLLLSKCSSLTDDSVSEVLSTLPSLVNLDLEELEELTSASLQALAAAPGREQLSHLCISYCENISDTGVLPILQHCPRLASIEMDNTRITDLVLIEAAATMASRNRVARGLYSGDIPTIGMRLVAYDCANITWSGINCILTCNAQETRATTQGGKSTFPSQIIGLKCFYNWQPTVDEHTKRVMRGDFVAATRLWRKWHDWMLYQEEAAAGGNTRARRRRARRAEAAHAEEEEAAGSGTGPGAGRRRRARSGPAASSGCSMM